jgi:predicted Rossmann fold flavoprotein
LQISSYWQPGEVVTINLVPNGLDLQQEKKQRPNVELKTVLSSLLPNRLVKVLCDTAFENKPMKQYSEPELDTIAQQLMHFEITPNGTEGYRTAEVTLGGVDTNEVSSKTFEAKKISGLYFIGEVLDVTGHLGGFNFQWAWSSGYCAGQFV